MHKLIVPLALLLIGASTARAQGTLSTQGFGYPPGQISTQAASMGGGPAETDPLTPLNPAALANWFRSGLYFQYSPEYRSVSAGGQVDHTMTARFPVMMGALNVGSRAMLGLSASTFLDRTWETSRKGFDHFGPDSAQFVENYKSAGAINDLRLALSYAVARSLWVGVGGDFFTGDDRLSIARISEDTTVAQFVQTSRLGYSGTGVSGGIMWQPASVVTLGVSGRIGGTIRSYSGDTVLSRGKVPKRIGAGVTVAVAPGVTVAARAGWDGWSSLGALGRPGLGVTDAWDMGAGAEIRGPSIFGASLPLRVGYRRRTLPFTVQGVDVRENTVSFGAGLPFARGRSRIDLGLDRASRSAIAGVAEHSWTFSAGVMVRP